jgi:hypothetical protein
LREDTNESCPTQTKKNKKKKKIGSKLQKNFDTTKKICATKNRDKKVCLFTKNLLQNLVLHSVVKNYIA